MSYERELLRAEQKNEEELLPLYREYDSMSRLQRIRHLGTAVRLSNRIAELERMIVTRREMYAFPEPEELGSAADDSAAETLVLRVEND